MVYLIEKGRIPANAIKDLHAATADPRAVLQHVPLDENIAIKMADFSRQDLPDLPDRVNQPDKCLVTWRATQP
jgi:hypothetical protein